MNAALLIERGLETFRRNLANGRYRVGRVSDGAMLARIQEQRQHGNPTHTVYCRQCRVYHPIHSDNHADLLCALDDFREKHPNHTVELASVPVWTPEGWQSNADVKEAFQSEQTATTTNLQSLASSATAGWCGTTVDNTSNLYLDWGWQLVIAAVNTAPGSNQATYVYAFHGNNSSDLTTTGTSGGTVGTEGSLTFPSIATPLPVVMPLITVIPYPVQNKAITSPWITVAKSTGGVLPPYHGPALLNYTGMTYASSGNTLKGRGVYNTVV